MDRAELHAIRSGPWKLHIRQREPVNYSKWFDLEQPDLYHLEHDVGELHDVAAKNPDVVKDLMERLEQHRSSIENVTDQLAIPIVQPK
ncbi:MAG: hypothetical protein R3C03_16355 [Pirellulaceae bacterium]